MAEIDDLLANMARRGVQRVLLVGDEPMRIYTPAGEARGSTITAPKLQALVREILPAELRPRLLQEGRYQFPHQAPAGSFSLSVERSAARLQVEVALTAMAEPAAQSEAESRAGASAAPRDWSPRALPALGSHAQAVTALALAPGGESVASAGADGTVFTWSIAPAQKLLTLRQPTGRITPSAPSIAQEAAPLDVAFSREGGSVAASGAGAVQVWDAARGAGQFKESVAGNSRVAFGAGGALAFSRGARVELWNLAKKKALRAYATPQEPLSLDISHEGRWLAVGDARSVHLGDLGAKPGALSSLQKSLARGDKAAPLTYSIEMGAPVTSLSFSPRGSGLALSAGGRCAVLDSATQRVLWRQSRQGVRAVAFAPSGTAIAAANDDGQVYFLEWASGAPSREPLRVSGGPVSALAFSGDGRLLVCGGADGQVSAWKLF